MESQTPTVGDSQDRKIRSWKLEIARLVGLAGSFAVVLALVTHVGSDPSLTTFSNVGRIQNWMGRAGAMVSDLLFQIVGLAAYALPVAGGWVSLTAGRRPALIRNRVRALGFFSLLVALSTLTELFCKQGIPSLFAHHAGGVLGLAGAVALEHVAGYVGAVLISFSILVASSIILFQWIDLMANGEMLVTRLARRTASFAWRMARKVADEAIGRLRKRVEAVSLDAVPVDEPHAEEPNFSAACTESLPKEVLEPSIAAAHVPIMIAESRVRAHRKVIAKRNDFKLPSLSMLSGKAESKAKMVEKGWYLEKANILVQKLKDFGVEGEVTHISPGPVITVYEFKPASGVKIKEIANLSDDLTLALSVLSVRIVAPIPGKPVIGIEIPSPHREMVFFKDLLHETPFFREELKIPVALGRMASGEPIAADLASMPHLLIAGTTGTGKSVFINTLISSLLFRFTPKELKLILVDPKMVELSLYEEIPHLLLPVVVDSKKAALALRWTVEEMERRYTLLHQLGVRHIDTYNARLQDFQKTGVASELVYMPYIVVVIDEYADLMAVVPKDVELSIARLAQKARASGIHLVLATQRPSTDVVTGTIKANFPSRISFRVASSVDSKTILDRAGAERLLGHGDLLFHSAGFMTLKRMQGPYISDSDIERMVNFLKAQGAPEYDEGILQAQESLDELTDDPNSEEEGELYDRALRLVTEKGEASISLIQRHLRIGYNRAATLMEELEKNGVVAQSTGASKRRAVIPQAI